MTKRDIEYLLSKYYGKNGETEVKQKGEIWTTEHHRRNKQEQRTYQKLDLLETIANGRFRFKEGQKARLRYLVKKLNFKKISTSTNEQVIIMLIIYVKLEYSNSNHITKYNHLLEEYDISKDTFISFLIQLNKFHARKLSL